MKFLTSIIVTSAILLFSQQAIAKNVPFKHDGVKVGSTIENCYRDPCSGAKVIGLKKLSSSSNSAMLELNVRGYSQDWNSKKKDWNKKPHKIYVTCSIDNPTVTVDGQVTTLPINTEMALAGVLQTDYAIYVQACHGKYIDEIKLAEKFGYDVQDY